MRIKEKSGMKGGLLCTAVAAVGLPLILLAPGRATKRQKAPFMGMNFAHRGLHSRDKSVPENSLEAFELASRAGYGMELDVQLSKDGQVVVFHDDTLERVCGVNARVDELTYEELKNGKRNRELCEKTYKLLSDYRGEVCIESFNPMIVGWFRRHAKDLVRGQLAMPASYYDGIKKPLAFLMSRGFTNILCRPQFIAYRIGKKPLTVRLAEKMGAMKVAWTSHEPKNEKGNDAVIFEFYKPRVNYK